MAFTKLFASIITSTIWMEPDKTRLVWITMLALADKNGEVQGSVPGLARMAGVDVEACRVALDCFLAPDPDSRTKDDEGRRIEEIDGGWLLLNHAKYRKMASKEEQIEKATARTRRYRESKARNGVSRDVYASSTPVHGNPTEAEAEADTDSVAKATGGEPPKCDPVKALFDDGLKLLTEAGTPEKQARSLIGGWRKAHGDEATRTAIQAAYDHGAIAPVEFIVARLTRAPKAHETWDQRRIREAMEAIQ